MFLSFSALSAPANAAVAFLFGGAAGVVVTPRTRVGRLPLPQRVAALTVADEPALEAVNDFADRLAEMPIDAWLDVGRRRIGDSLVAEQSEAFVLLDSAISTHGLGVVAWYVRDAVETSAFLAASGMSRWTSNTRRQFAAAHGIAEDAALALLAREMLDPTDFAALVAPFEHLLRASPTAPRIHPESMKGTRR